jgi:prepilin-type N-terminal cleavage/methylation domain-containing protein
MKSMSHASEQGVSLVELMAVVCIVGIFSAMAAPTIGGAMAERYSARAASEIAGLFEEARTRALATGAAHRVSVTAAGVVTVTAAQAAPSAGGTPNSSCVLTDWTNAVTTTVIDTFDPGSGPYQGHPLQVIATAQEYCINPAGFTWSRAPGAAWVRMAGTTVNSITVQRLNSASVATGFLRTVRIGPNALTVISLQ